jgi:hypothetical protein
MLVEAAGEVLLSALDEGSELFAFTASRQRLRHAAGCYDAVNSQVADRFTENAHDGQIPSMLAESGREIGLGFVEEVGKRLRDRRWGVVGGAHAPERRGDVSFWVSNELRA